MTCHDYRDYLPYVSHVLDTALSPNRAKSDIGTGSMLVSFQCGFEPLVVAVVGAYDGEQVEAEEAEEIAVDYLEEIGWFGEEGPREADLVIAVLY